MSNSVSNPTSNTITSHVDLSTRIDTRKGMYRFADIMQQISPSIQSHSKYPSSIHFKTPPKSAVWPKRSLEKPTQNKLNDKKLD